MFDELVVPPQSLTTPWTLGPLFPGSETRMRMDWPLRVRAARLSSH